MASAVDNIEQVKIVKLFGVMFSGNLNFDEHVTYVLSICSQRLYLIKLLRSQGMPEDKLHIIFVAVISRISYALSAWGGFLNSQQINRVNALLRLGICSSTCICAVLEHLRLVDSRLFNSIQSPSHCLSHLYFHQNSTLADVPEDIAMHSLYAKITFVSTPLFPDVYFVTYNNCVFIIFCVAIVLGLNICVCHLFLMKRYQIFESSFVAC